MITFVTGKPGDGKSMYGMKLICDTLLNSNRIVATNIAVKLPELRAYLISKGWKPKPGRDIRDRVIILDHEDVFEFYRFRSGGYVLPPSPDWVRARENEDADGNKLKKLSRFQLLRIMTEQMREMKKHPRALTPVEYHIDEAHDYFSAREWTDTGRGILWYASKHRHLHDEIILYTQVMANVEGQLRGLASFTVRARNQIRMRWGPFRKAPIFRLYHYYGGPEDTEKAVPFDQSVMQLDVQGLCRTYNSAGALSVHSKPEEVRNKAPLPYWALPLAGGIAVLIVVVVMALMPLMVGKYAGARIKASTEASAQKVGMPTLPGSDGNASVTSAPAKKQAAQLALPQVLEEDTMPKVTGVMTVGQRIMVLTKGYEWATVLRELGGGMVELSNGLVIRRADMLAAAARSGKVQSRQDKPVGGIASGGQ